MMLLFSEPGLSRLGEIAKPGILCIFNFDGTLAPIVSQPDKARLPLGILHRLVELSACAPIAIVTGRSLSDIRKRLGFMPEFVAGNHGLEGLPGQEEISLPHQSMCRDWEKALSPMLASEGLTPPGIWIENKKCSLSVHYRLAREPVFAEHRLPKLFAALSPSPHVVSGKCVFNLLPPDAGNKAAAVERLMRESGASSAIYVGDDVTDEDVFRLRRPELMSVRIERATDSAAEFFLNNRVDIIPLLDGIIVRLQQNRAVNWLSRQRPSKSSC